MIRNNQRRRRGGGNNGPRPQQMAGGNNYGNRLDNRQRGNATQLLEKYRALARDAQQAGDRVTAEYYLQYAEHYYRVLGDYRDRQPEGRGTGRQGREGFDDELQDNEELESDAAESEGDEDAGESGREERSREERSREDRGRDGRNRNDRNREDRPREERSRDDRPREERGRDDRSRRDWQRDRRDRRGDAPRSEAPAAEEAGDDRESLLQALPPPVAREAAPAEGRRLSLKREAARADDSPSVEPSASDADSPEAAPKRRGRPRRAVAEPAAE